MTIYYDLSSGISGDMNLAALVDLGADKEYLSKELSKLNLNDEFELSFKEVLKNGIKAIKAEVRLKTHTHHRSYKSIKELINSSNLTNFVKENSIKVFETIALAEAKVHNISIENVHFHEIGATDSIVDIVGAFICLENLDVNEILSCAAELGGGTVRCEHGILSVPAPATIEILKEFPVTIGRDNFEMTTPTGAGFIKANAKFIKTPNLVVGKIGYGAGNKDAAFPNVLRIMLCKKSENEIYQTIIETNIDDMSSENLAFLCEKLFKNGALDVFCQSIMMKKGRIGIKLSVLCKNEDSKNLKTLIFKESTSLGIREYNVKKTELKREFVNVATKFGEISMKVAFMDDKILKFKPEFSQCKDLALKFDLPINQIKQEAIDEFRKTKV